MGQDKRTTVFCRDDDVDEWTPELHAILETFLRAEVPVNYLIIPNDLTDEAVDNILMRKAQYSDLVYLNQHGYRHRQNIGGQQRFSEFAANRPYEEQLADIGRGKRILAKALGSHFDSLVFTPPCHKYDANTLRALCDLGFEVLSASIYYSWAPRVQRSLGQWFGAVRMMGKAVSYHGGKTPGLALWQLSVAIDVDMQRSAAGFVVKSATELMREFQVARTHSPFVGIMLHHSTYRDPRKLATLRQFLRDLKGDPTLEFSSIEKIATRLSSWNNTPQISSGPIDAGAGHIRRSKSSSSGTGS